MIQVERLEQCNRQLGVLNKTRYVIAGYTTVDQ